MKYDKLVSIQKQFLQRESTLLRAIEELEARYGILCVKRQLTINGRKKSIVSDMRATKDRLVLFNPD